jgi:putative tryptophan/tyrosine transport system substrate-binding protein
VTRAEDIDRAFRAITEQHSQALIVQGPNPVLFTNQGRIVSFAQRTRLPVMYPVREYVDSGGLMSYGPSQTDLFRRIAAYVNKIIRGAKPAELPVEQPTKFELVINLKTAKVLDLTVPQSLLVRADEIIR